MFDAKEVIAIVSHDLGGLPKGGYIMTKHGWVFMYSGELESVNEKRTCYLLETERMDFIPMGEAKPCVLLSLDRYEKLLLDAANAAESRLQDREWMDDIMGVRHVA